RLPVLPETGIPRGLRLQPQGVQLDAVEPDLRVRQTRWRVDARMVAPVGQRRTPEGREYTVRPALLRRQLPWLEQQRAIEARDMQPITAQRLLDPGIAAFDGRLIATVPVHRLRVTHRRQRAQDLEAGAGMDAQPRSPLAQRRIQRQQRAVSPGIRRPARSPVTLFLRCMDIDADRRLAGIERSLQRRVVGKPEVVAEPDDRVGHGAVCRAAANAEDQPSKLPMASCARLSKRVYSPKNFSLNAPVG